MPVAPKTRKKSENLLTVSFSAKVRGTIATSRMGTWPAQNDSRSPGGYNIHFWVVVEDAAERKTMLR